MGSFMGGMAHAHQRQGVMHPLLELLLALLASKHPLHRQVNVVVATQPGQQRVVLKDHGPLRPRTGNLATIADQPTLRWSRDCRSDRKSTRLNSSHSQIS